MVLAGCVSEGFGGARRHALAHRCTAGSSGRSPRRVATAPRLAHLTTSLTDKPGHDEMRWPQASPGRGRGDDTDQASAWCPGSGRGVRGEPPGDGGAGGFMSPAGRSEPNGPRRRLRADRPGDGPGTVTDHPDRSSDEQRRDGRGGRRGDHRRGGQPGPTRPATASGRIALDGSCRRSAGTSPENDDPPGASPRVASPGPGRPLGSRRGALPSRTPVAGSRHHLPVFGIELQGSAGGRASPFCRSSIEMLSGERTKAMRPSRGGRLMTTPSACRRAQVA